VPFEFWIGFLEFMEECEGESKGKDRKRERERERELGVVTL
jgi:hypothetical protein